MNYALRLDTTEVCRNCLDICFPEQMHPDQFELCDACGDRAEAMAETERLDEESDDLTGGEARYCGGMR